MLIEKGFEGYAINPSCAVSQIQDINPLLRSPLCLTSISQFGELRLCLREKDSVLLSVPLLFALKYRHVITVIVQVGDRFRRITGQVFCTCSYHAQSSVGSLQSTAAPEMAEVMGLISGSNTVGRLDCACTILSHRLPRESVPPKEITVLLLTRPDLREKSLYLSETRWRLEDSKGSNPGGVNEDDQY